MYIYLYVILFIKKMHRLERILYMCFLLPCVCEFCAFLIIYIYEFIYIYLHIKKRYEKKETFLHVITIICEKNKKMKKREKFIIEIKLLDCLEKK